MINIQDPPMISNDAFISVSICAGAGDFRSFAKNNIARLQEKCLRGFMPSP